MDNSLAHLMSWSEGTKGDVPPPLTGPSVTLSPLQSPSRPTVFVFGGKYVQTRLLTAEVWALDIPTKVWEKVDAGEGPGARYFHSMDTWEDKLVCFGGMSDADPMSVHGDIWFFDCRTRRWLPPPSPAAGISQDPSVLPLARYAHLSSVSRGKLVISGGQHADNSWIYEINIYDLRRQVWISKTAQPELQGLHSKGAYRSVAISSRQRVIMPVNGGELKGSQAPSYSIDEDGEGGEIWCYSNYDFAKVRRELDVIAPSDLDTELVPSPKFHSPPLFSIRDDSRLMRGTSQPPGLRFPTGGIIGSHFILCGLYLASTSAAFSVWALDLTTMIWRHLEPAVLSTGSWNRAVIWPQGAKLLVFGNLRQDLSADYGKRAVNLENMAVISLETYGIYQPPTLDIPAKIQEVGLSMLDEKLASDFDVVCDDGRKIKCSRRLLSERWAWFAEEEKKLQQAVQGALLDPPAVDINDTLLGSFVPAKLTATSLHIPEPLPVCIALVQYFYTLSLSTPLQNRAPVLSALLFLAKQYKIDRLQVLVIHALHARLEPNVAVGVYEIATLSGEQNLQVRALSLVHSGKGGSSSRNYRQGPPGSTVQDQSQSKISTTSPPSVPASTSVASSSDAGGFMPRVDEGTFRRARADSITLPLPADEVERVDRLLAALDIAEDVPRPESPTERAIPRVAPPRLPVRQLPPSLPPPSGQLPLPGSVPASRTQSLTSTTYSFPRTPEESVQESFIIPSGGLPMEIRRSFSSVSALETLPEDEDFHAGKNKREGFYLSPVTLEVAGLLPSSILPDYPVSLRSQSPVPQSTLFTGYPTSIPPQMHLAPQHMPPAPPSAFTYNFPPPNSDTSSHYSSHSRCPSLTSGTSAGSFLDSRYSVQTQSSGQSSDSMYSLRKAYPYLTYGTDTIPDSATESEFTISLNQPQQGQNLVRSATIITTRDNMSISSGSTGATGTSSKAMAKLEKKMIAQAEKDARAAEARAKFEALRAEQQKRMALSRAKAQREAEIEAAKPVTPKSQAKSRLGKLGQKFSEAVLFPEGGKNSTMF